MAYDVEYAQLQPEQDEDLSIKDMILIGLATIFIIGTISVVGNNTIPPCQDEFVFDYFP